MNTDNLHELIDRYESNLDMLCGSVHDELFKWRALKTWQVEWFKPADAYRRGISISPRIISNN